MHLLFSMQFSAHIAKFHSSCFSLVQTVKTSETVFGARWIIVKPGEAWSASWHGGFCSRAFRECLGSFVSFFLCPSEHRSLAGWAQSLGAPLCRGVSPCFFLPFYVWTENLWDCIFQGRFVRIPVYLMNKLLKLMLCCSQCNKRYFSQNEQSYLLLANSEAQFAHDTVWPLLR